MTPPRNESSGAECVPSCCHRAGIPKRRGCELSSVVRLNLLVMQQLEAYIGGVSELFDGDHLNNAETDAFLKNFMKSFAN
jgi:hypothetical protein